VWTFLLLMDRNQNRKRVRDTDASPPSVSQTRKLTGYQIQSVHWLPCQTPRELNIPLDFNFWMKSRFISNAELHELITFILCQQNIFSSTFFLDKSFQTLPRSNRIIVLSIHGITPTELSECLANSLIPSLLTFTSVPIRHTISSTLQHLPETTNLSLADNIWRYTDAAPASSLIYWPIVPAMSYEEVHSYQNSILSLFSDYRLVLKVPSLSRSHFFGLPLIPVPLLRCQMLLENLLERSSLWGMPQKDCVSLYQDDCASLPKMSLNLVTLPFLSPFAFAHV
jgi:hypothetical protein